MSTNTGQSLGRRTAWAGGIIVALVLAAHFLLPVVANTAWMRHRILSLAAERFPGELNYGTIKPVLLPRPRAVITEARLGQANKFDLHASRAVIYPQLWPLLFGRLKIDRLTVQKPDLEIILPAQISTGKERSWDQSSRAVESRIRSALAEVFEKLGLPAIRMEDGRLVLRRQGQTGLDIGHIFFSADVSGQILTMDLTARSNLFGEISLAQRIDLSTLDGSGRLTLSRLDTSQLAAYGLAAGTASMPAAVINLDLHLKNRALESFQSEILAKAPEIVFKNKSRQLAVSDFLLKGEVRWTSGQVQIAHLNLHAGAPALDVTGGATWSLVDSPPTLPSELQLKSVGMDIAPIRSAALQLAGDLGTVEDIFNIIRGGRVAEFVVTLGRPGADSRGMRTRLALKGRLTEGSIVLPNDLLNLEGVNGAFVLEKGRLSASHISARSGGTVSRNGTLELDLLNATREFRLATDIDADLSEAVPIIKRLTGKGENGQGLPDRIPKISGRAKGRLRLGDNLDRLSGGIDASAHIELLDAAMEASATIAWLPSSLTDVETELSGNIGPRAAQWLQQWGSVPDDLLLEAPVMVNHAHLSWKAEGGLGVKGEFSTASGLRMDAALGVSREMLSLSMLRLRDDTSDAEIVIKHPRNSSNWHIGFNGRLSRVTASKILRRNNIIGGWLDGDLQVDLHTDALLRTQVTGRLECRQITIPRGPAPDLNILDAALVGRGRRIEINTAGLRWRQNTARLTGSGTFTSKSLDLDLALSADILDVDQIASAAKTGKPSDDKPSTTGDLAFPVRGRIRVQAGHLILGGYHIASVRAAITLEDDGISAKVGAADLCGISAPGRIHYGQDGWQMNFKPSASQTALRDTDRCLAGASITERLEGAVSTSGNIQTHGRTGGELNRNLSGSLKISIENGRVFNVGAAGFFTNLLSFISVNQLIEGKLPDLRKDDFEFKSLSSILNLKDGKLVVEEVVLKSNAVNIVGNGDYAVASRKLDLVLLVSPLTTVDWIVERIPLIGNILQGTLVAIPVGVKGAVDNPHVIPLSPSAVGSRLGGILKRTIKTPFRILSPLLEGTSESGP